MKILWRLINSPFNYSDLIVSGSSHQQQFRDASWNLHLEGAVLMVHKKNTLLNLQAKASPPPRILFWQLPSFKSALWTEFPCTFIHATVIREEKTLYREQWGHSKNIVASPPPSRLSTHMPAQTHTHILKQNLQLPSKLDLDHPVGLVYPLSPLRVE